MLATIPLNHLRRCALYLAERFKQLADEHWTIDPHVSLRYADIIIAIGVRSGVAAVLPLGWMARGDALKLLNRLEEAWDALIYAGELYLAAADPVGWARTRIGLLAICVDLGRFDTLIADAAAASDILASHGEQQKLARLQLNLAISYSLHGEHQQALAICQAALDHTARNLPDERDLLGMMAITLGYTYDALGMLKAALAAYDQARAYLPVHARSALAAVDLNCARIYRFQGRYRQALRLLDDAQAGESGALPKERVYIQRIQVECYLDLGRYREALALAQQASQEFLSAGARNEAALTALHSAAAAARLGDSAAARSALDQAAAIFQELDAQTSLAIVRTQRAALALAQRDEPLASSEAAAAAACFAAGGQQVHAANALLLLAQGALLRGDHQAARQAGAQVLAIARACFVSMLRYRAHVLLGQSAELAGDQRRASRFYHAAAATVDRIQHGLTIALRAQFMGDHGEASRALINLLLRSSRAQAALYALERAKAQVLLAFLGHHHQYRWPSDSARSQTLISELEQLRNEHQRYYYLLYEHPAPSEKPAGPDAEQLRAGVAARERRMRAITEQLYLLTPEGKAGRAAPPALGAIQQALGGDSLIEFYDDGRQFWAFLIDADGLEALPLALDSALLNQRVDQLYTNISSALTCLPGDAAAEQLTPLVQRTLRRLHEALLGPLLQRLRGRRRLFIVPYGGSHFVPFNLLHDGDGYLVESHEVVVLPAASALMRPPPRRPAGARVLAHSWSGRLSHAIREGELVSALWDGELHAHAAARRSALAASPTQILHIAAHGEYRFDAPDFSYIRLDDGQLFIDDILQNDVSYELITLSACQTGRAQIVGGDEVIGLGRSFLYAGAGAVIAGLWQVPDDTSLELMGGLYGALRAGAARSAALRQAQRALLAANPALHPAFWGAFQLIGDAGPLSGGPA